MKPITHIANISGGIDSLATALVAREKGVTARHWFCNTGNENQITLDYVDYLEDALGEPIERLKADFTEWMAERRESLPREWGREKRRTRHTPDCNARRNVLTRSEWKQLCDCPVAISPPLPDALIARAQQLLKPTGNPFLDLCMIKGRFPSRKAQFCTEELKVMPAMVKAQALHDAGHNVVSWLGERDDESKDRAAKPSLQRIRMPGGTNRILWRPIKPWKKEQCFDIARRHGIKPNPLYSMGMGRVGCMPCINCKKDELRQISHRFPGEIDRIEEWEQLVAEVSRRGMATFFAISAAPDGEPIWEGAGIRDAVEWSRTTRGGKQYSLETWLIEQEPPSMCESAFGLCE